MPKGGKNMDNKSYEKFLITQATIKSNTQSTIEANRQETDYKLMNPTEDIIFFPSTITSMINSLKNSKSSTAHKNI